MIWTCQRSWRCWKILPRPSKLCQLCLPQAQFRRKRKQYIMSTEKPIWRRRWQCSKFWPKLAYIIQQWLAGRPSAPSFHVSYYNIVHSKTVSVQQWKTFGLGVAAGSLLAAFFANRLQKRTNKTLRIGLLGMGAINTDVARALVAGSHGLSTKHAKLVTVLWAFSTIFLVQDFEWCVNANHIYSLRWLCLCVASVRIFPNGCPRMYASRLMRRHSSPKDANSLSKRLARNLFEYTGKISWREGSIY